MRKYGRRRVVPVRASHDGRFARVPAGAFLMGSDDGQDDERPVHRVHVDAFEMSIYPVTRGEYARFLDGDRPRAAARLDRSGLRRRRSAGRRRQLARRGGLLRLVRTAAAMPQRLPTEAEWERAARGGREGAAFPWGDAIPSWIPEGGRGPLPAPGR